MVILVLLIVEWFSYRQTGWAMTERQMQAILDLVEVFKLRQSKIIKRYDSQKNKELAVLDEEFDKKLKEILVS